MKHLLCFYIIAFTIVAKTQAQQRLVPDIQELLSFNAEEEKLIQRRDALLDKDNLTPAEQKELDKLLEKYSEVDRSIWEAVGGGCSWYCGGGPYKVTASSQLPPSGQTTYNAQNIHDLDYKNVWAEGVKGYGIGEYIEYHFKPQLTQITEIRIANGYVKSDKAWFENSRVKTLNMYFNGEYYLTLELNDTKALQSFKLDKPLGITEGEKDWVLKFEITDVYRGDKYDDVVISELFFDGIGDH